MKINKIFTVASIIAFFALLPALIILEVRVLRLMPEILYLFVIMNILLVGFIVLEIVLLYRNWKKEKQIAISPKEEEIVITREWGEQTTTKEEQLKGK